MGFKSGFVGVLGQANVGKSSFINAILGKKILIVSPKPQSTRHRIRCIATWDDAQIIFIDTPGLHEPHTKLSKYLVKQVFAALDGLDVVVYMVEPWGRVWEQDQEALARMKKLSQPILLLINQIDTAEGDAVQRTLDAYQALGIFTDIWPISCTRSIQLGPALDAIKRALPEGPKYFPDGTPTDRPEEFFIAELIREKIYQLTREEIPYASTVEIFEVREREDRPLLEVFGTIYVARDSQKGILVGQGGRMIREIGRLARREIEALLGTQVFLDLHVKVREGWNEDEQLIREMLGRE
jgi:GTP-binding protein Era